MARILIQRRLQRAMLQGLLRAYSRLKVDPAEFLTRLRRAHSLPLRSFRDMFLLPPGTLDGLADQTIAAAAKLALLEGAGMGLGGFFTVIPDVGLLSAIVVRMLQKLSLLYGFEYATEEDEAVFWLAAASAAGLDLGRDFLEKQAVERLVPRVIERVAVRMGAEVAEKWSARLIPIASGAIGGALNYYFVREWGRRAKRHFRERHLLARTAAPQLPALPPYETPLPAW
jgi:hypothetical protein